MTTVRLTSEFGHRRHSHSVVDAAASLPIGPRHGQTLPVTATVEQIHRHRPINFVIGASLVVSLSQSM